LVRGHLFSWRHACHLFFLPWPFCTWSKLRVSEGQTSLRQITMSIGLFGALSAHKCPHRLYTGGTNIFTLCPFPEINLQLSPQTSLSPSFQSALSSPTCRIYCHYCPLGHNPHKQVCK
jgi:hypothetical protein